MGSPAFSILAGALLSALIVICLVVSITALAGATVSIVVFYTYRFVSAQIVQIRTFALGYLKIIMQNFNKFLKVNQV